MGKDDVEVIEYEMEGCQIAYWEYNPMSITHITNYTIADDVVLMTWLIG